MKIFTLNYRGIRNLDILFRKYGQVARILILLVVLMVSVSSSYGQVIQVTEPKVGFNIDGDLTAGGTPSSSGDWLSVDPVTTPPVYEPYQPSVNGFIFNVINGNSSTATVTNVYNDHTLFVRDPYQSGTDMYFTSGKRDEDPNTAWSWGLGSISPPKNDINNAFFYLGTVPRSGNTPGKQWLFIGADGGSGGGSKILGIELLQNTLVANSNNTFTSHAPYNTVNPGPKGGGGRTQNDILLQITYGGGSATIELFVWVYENSQWKYKDYTSALAGLYYAKTNTGTINAPFGAFNGYTYGDNQFVEAAINITDVFKILDSCLWIKVKTLLIKSQTGNSANSSLSDFIQPVIQANLDLGTAISYNGPFCPTGGTATVTQVGDLGGTYSSSDPRLQVNPTTGEITIPSSNSGAGTYVVSYTYVPVGCTLTQTVSTNVVIHPNPTITSPSAKTICSGANTNISLTADVPGTTFTWILGTVNGVTGATANSTAACSDCSCWCCVSACSSPAYSRR